MKNINKLTKEKLKDIKMIAFDVDGVLVPRGTKIKQDGNITTFETKKIAKRQIEQIKELHKRGIHINISSGRALYMLQEMFREVLEFVSITYENGSATWFDGKIKQHINAFRMLNLVFKDLSKVNNLAIIGYEPKEFIITIHAKERIDEIESIVATHTQLICIWNGEAYDIMEKHHHNKGRGLVNVTHQMKILWYEVLAIGDNYNDKELLDAAGISVTADKGRIVGDYYVPLKRVKLPAELLMDQIIKEMKK